MKMLTGARSSRTWWRGDEGATAALFAMMVVALLAFAAIVVDAGVLYSERRELQTGADAAALAGVQELPGDPSSAVAIAAGYSGTNAPQATDNDYAVSSTYGANDTLTAVLTNPAKGLFFARLLGHPTEPMTAKATAVISSPTAYNSKVMPFGVMSKEPSDTAPFGYVFNELVVLKQSTSSSPGNFQFLDVIGEPEESGGGASDIYDALGTGGAPNVVYRDELYYTQTGINGKHVVDSNKPGWGLNNWVASDPHSPCSFDTVVRQNDDDTVDILVPECHRLIVCPIIVDPGPPISYSWSDVSGSKKVLIIGFAYFYVEDMGGGGGSEECWVSGRFVRPLGPDEAVEYGSIDPFGAVAFRLTD